MTKNRAVVNNRKRMKAKAVQYKGGKCALCGYNKCNRGLTFHHVYPKKKSYRISSGNTVSWSKYKKEVDKCVLLCHNCHNEHHDGLIPNEQVLAAYKVTSGYEQTEFYFAKQNYNWSSRKVTADKPARHETKKKCPSCKKEFFGRTKYCSHKCYISSKYKITWPTKEELKELVWSYPTTVVANRLGVSDKAVEKRCKKQNIEKPPRGYWAKNKDLLLGS